MICGIMKPIGTPLWVLEGGMARPAWTSSLKQPYTAWKCVEQVLPVQVLQRSTLSWYHSNAGRSALGSVIRKCSLQPDITTTLDCLR